MDEGKKAKPGLIQHKLRSEIKQWIEEEAKAQERSQAWFVNKIVEDAYTRRARQQPQGTAQTKVPGEDK